MQLLTNADANGAGAVQAWRGGSGTILIGEGTAGVADDFDGATVAVEASRFAAGPWIPLAGIAAQTPGAYNVTLRPCFLRANVTGGAESTQSINASIQEVDGEPEGKL